MSPWEELLLRTVIVHHKLLRVLSSYFVHVLKWDVIFSHSHLVVESGRVFHLSPELAGWLVLVVSALGIWTLFLTLVTSFYTLSASLALVEQFLTRTTDPHFKSPDRDCLRLHCPVHLPLLSLSFVPQPQSGSVLSHSPVAAVHHSGSLLLRSPSQ